MSELEIPEFQRYQLAFTAHIRDPIHAPPPPGVAVERMAVYVELLYNNLESFLLACFPVTRKIMGKQRWGRIVRCFMRDHACSTPLFRQIPEEFVKFLQGEACPRRLPRYLPHLAHYEWIELKLDVASATPDWNRIDPEGDMLSGYPELNPVMMVLVYPYPVHRISQKYKPRPAESETTCLLVYRDLGDEVRFVEINPLTAHLLELLRTESITGEAALRRIAGHMKHPNPEIVIAGGLDILNDLRQQQAILGARAY